MDITVLALVPVPWNQLISTMVQQVDEQLDRDPLVFARWDVDRLRSMAAKIENAINAIESLERC